jgi:nucleotide-binding universal stress UspA family protein
MFKRIVVAIDGSAPSTHAFNMALGLAREQHAELHAVHVVDAAAALRGIAGAGFGAPQYLQTMLDDLRAAGAKTLAHAHAAATRSGQPLNGVLVDTQGGTVAQAILSQARRLHADVIVMGTHGRRGLGRLVMGSDAEGVLREARVPVLLVRSRAITPSASVGAAGETARERAAPEPAVHA